MTTHKEYCAYWQSQHGFYYYHTKYHCNTIWLNSTAKMHRKYQNYQLLQGQCVRLFLKIIVGPMVSHMLGPGMAASLKPAKTAISINFNSV